MLVASSINLGIGSGITDSQERPEVTVTDHRARTDLYPSHPPLRKPSVNCPFTHTAEACRRFRDRVQLWKIRVLFLCRHVCFVIAENPLQAAVDLRV